MPHNKSCKKRLRNARKQRLSNRDNRAHTRGVIKDFRTAIDTNAEMDRAAELSRLYSVLDVQVRKGILPKKRVSRLKSRLAAFAAK